MTSAKTLTPVLTVRVTPNASHDRITGFSGEGVLHIRISKPPADGKANKQLIRLLSKALGTAKSNIHIVRGDTSRIKQLAVTGLTTAAIRLRLQGQ